MFKVLDILYIRDKCCVTIEGDCRLINNGLRLIDENENEFIIESVGMVNYINQENFLKFAQIIITGNTQSLGKILKIKKE